MRIGDCFTQRRRNDESRSDGEAETRSHGLPHSARIVRNVLQLKSPSVRYCDGEITHKKADSAKYRALRNEDLGQVSKIVSRIW